jgi:hypothetical protein
MTYAEKISTGRFNGKVAAAGAATVLLAGAARCPPPLRFAAGAVDDATEHLPK